MNSTIIIGGGVIGLLTALELHKAGQKVTIIDRQALGQESSWAGGGIISPLFPWRYPEAITRLATLSQQIYPELLDHMQQATGKDPEFLPSGMLVLGDYDDENPQQWANQHKINMQKVDSQQIHQLAPEISDQWQTGWWFPEVHQVRNPKLVKLLKAYLQTTDITVIENEPVNEIVIQQDTVTAVRTDAATYHADQFVIAGGAWSSLLLEQTGINIGIKPVKGQMLLLKGAPDLVKRITLSEDRYIIPRKDGHVLVGSTTEDAGFDKSTSTEIRQQLLDYAIRTIPTLASCSIQQQWSGLRPGSSNGLPKIGQHPELTNLFINSGHYRNGLVMAPASTRLLSEIMLHTKTCLPEHDYTPRDALHNNK